MPPGRTVLLTCGNPAVMEEVEAIALGRGLQFEKEDW
jgi:hypothetical protein